MSTVELKSNIHAIVDTIQNQQFLSMVYEFLKSNSKTTGVWDSLTAEQKQEVMLAFEESEDESNLVEADKVLKKYK
jgi:hypothetical protein